MCNCCVFWPAFWCCKHPKAGWNTFFSRFKPFLFFLNLFQWFHTWNHQNIWKWTKIDICQLLKAGWHAKPGWLPEEGTSNLSFLGWFFNWQRYKKNKKGWKRMKKSSFDHLSGAASTWKLVKIHNTRVFSLLMEQGILRLEGWHSMLIF